jgi:hypothetical protein
LIESAYENDFMDPTPLRVRQETWDAMTNGGMGFQYGNLPIWSMSAGWQAALGTVGAQDMSHAIAILHSVRWSELVPDTGGAFLTAGAGSGSSHASAGLTPDGRQALAYVPAVRALTFNLAKMAGAANARWIDPTSGASTPVSGGPFTGSHAFTPPGNNSRGDADWVLALDVAP